MTAVLAIASVSLAIWLYLVAGRGWFWLGYEHESRDALPTAPDEWPSVVAVVPARNEADMLPRSLGSLLAQDYPGAFSIIVVDDQSDDGTSDVARRTGSGSAREVIVLKGEPLPPGWAGKVWAMQQGIAHAGRLPAPPEFILLTDADIAYAPDTLSRIVQRARVGRLVLVSQMAKLNCESFAERALVPAFVFFFQMLYPFRWVNSLTSATAAAAGGSMLVNRAALERVGGIGAIRGALIDDCALGKVMKAQGPIWLGLSERVVSLRSYPQISDIRRMVARSAYAQLGYSPLILAGTIAGMLLTYLAPPLVAMAGLFPANAVAGAAWASMALAFQPTLRLYRLSPLWGTALPMIAAAYLAFTVDSAYQHVRGRGGLWKGRVQALPARR